VKVPVDIMLPSSVGTLEATIKAVEKRFGLPVGFVVIDTFAKAIAYGGGDENSAKDQNRARAHLREVQGRTNIHLALVGHTGKDETRGERGSNAGLGDVDVEVRITGDLAKTATVTKANDQPEGPLTSFSLETFEFGRDEDGDPITTAVVSDEVPQREGRESARRTLTDRQKMALDALTEAVISFGCAPPASLQLARDVLAVKESEWRDEMFRRGVLDPEAPNPRADFFRVRDSLVARGLVGLRDGLVWKAKP
jgi:hypothetical protein